MLQEVINNLELPRNQPHQLMGDHVLTPMSMTQKPIAVQELGWGGSIGCLIRLIGPQLESQSWSAVSISGSNPTTSQWDPPRTTHRNTTTLTLSHCPTHGTQAPQSPHHSPTWMNVDSCFFFIFFPCHFMPLGAYIIFNFFSYSQKRKLYRAVLILIEFFLSPQYKNKTQVMFIFLFFIQLKVTY